MKILKDSVGAEIVAEVASLSVVSGESNIIQVLEFSTGIYSYPSRENPDVVEEKQVNYIVTNLAEHGELFGFLGKYGAFPEPIARNFY